MSNITTDRAVKKAYFTNLEGGHLLEFQFSPHELDFREGGKFVDRIPTGNYFNDLTWISGTPSDFSVRMFVDRTQESYTVENFNTDPFEGVKRFPNSNPRFTSFDVVNLIRGIARSNTSSGFVSTFKKKNQDGANEVAPSNYSASPHYIQNDFSAGQGVIPDLEALMYYVRPKGLNLADMTIQTDGTINIKDFSQGRFTPPPKCRFYYGSLWREGYIVDIKYNLSVMNKQLVPRRLDAIIKMACTKWGYLNELGSSDNIGATDIFDLRPELTNGSAI